MNYKEIQLMHPFERILSVTKEDIDLTKEDIDLTLRGNADLDWAEFWLNPRRLRSSDFLMRWSQGVWSERRLTAAIGETTEFFAIPYGPSGTAPTNDVRAFELYFERLEAAGLGNLKRPDLLIYRQTDKPFVDEFLRHIGGVEELPFTSETELTGLLKKALLAIECENSLWVARSMPNYATPLTKQRRLNGLLGLKKNAVLPTVIIKDEDLAPLQRWEKANGVPIHIWHVFYDEAFGLALSEAERLLREGLIQPTIQTFQAPGGATTNKAIYKFYYHYAYPLGVATERPTLLPAFIQDKNGHILPYVTFEGGSLSIADSALNLLRQL